MHRIVPLQMLVFQMIDLVSEAISLPVNVRGLLIY
jgi:hypothetical protein